MKIKKHVIHAFIMLPESKVETLIYGALTIYRKGIELIREWQELQEIEIVINNFLAQLFFTSWNNRPEGFPYLPCSSARRGIDLPCLFGTVARHNDCEEGLRF